MRSTSRGGFSVRGIFTIVLTVLMTVLLATTLASTPANAQSPTGNWKGESITYDGRQYFAAEPATAGQSHGLPEGTQYYVAVEEISERPLVRKAHVIYFAPGNSPPTATSAEYVVYDYSPSEVYSNPEGRTTITMTPQAESNDYASSCTVEGIGWFVCPITVWLANAMDWIYEQIARLVAVPPVAVNDVNTPLYTAWNVMRSFANIAFVIVFLIIIYSQLTSWGVSNYGLKKLIPRLIVAAILVNVSFYVTALAVDLSNLAGYGLQEILISIRNNTFAITNDTWSSDATNTWSTLTAFVLSGGAVTAGWIGLSIATMGSVASAVYLLIPLLIGLAVTVFVVLLILAARQAIIVILIVLAPLAFVANLLPNTEKWFDKWKDLFMTMLIFFPAFSLVFGGSQLAGGIIIQNANNFIMMIFGMAVQVAPLVITPLLLKLSGGLLGRIAGLVNNPGKGFIDRSKNWANDRAAMHRAKSAGKNVRGNPFRATGQFFDGRRRNVKKGTEVYEQMAETRYMERNGKYAKLTDAEHEAHMDREIVDNTHKLRAQDHMNHVGSTAHIKNAQVEAGKLAVERATQATAADISEYRAGHVPVGASTALTDTITRLNAERQALSIEKTRASNAEGVAQERLADALINDPNLRTRAGGIDEHGADAALANAISTVRESYNKSVGEARQIIKHFNLSSNERQQLALGETVTATRADGTSHTFTASDLFAREAVIEDQVATGTIEQVDQLVMASGKNAKLAQFRTTISEAVAKNGLGGKTLYLGGKTIDDIAQGRFGDENALMAAVVETIGKGKISEKDLANIDKDAVKRLWSAAELIQNNQVPAGVDPALLPALRARLDDFSRVAQDTLVGDERVNVKPNAKEFILRVARLKDPNFQEGPIPRPPEERE
mgnify:FL=1